MIHIPDAECVVLAEKRIGYFASLDWCGMTWREVVREALA